MKNSTVMFHKSLGIPIWFPEERSSFDHHNQRGIVFFIIYYFYISLSDMTETVDNN